MKRSRCPYFFEFRIIYLIEFTFIASLYSCSPTMIEYCGNNKTNPVTIYRNPMKAYPSYAKEYKNTIKANIDILDSIKNKPNIKAGTEIGISSKIIELREKLNQESIVMEGVLKNVFFAFNARPCDSKVNDEYFKINNIIAEKTVELAKLKAGITKPSGQGSGNIENIKPNDNLEEVKTSIDKFTNNYAFKTN